MKLHKTFESFSNSLNEYGLSHDDAYNMLDIAAQYTSTAHQAASQMWSDAQDLYDYIVSDHIRSKKDKKAFYKSVKREFPEVNESVNESEEIKEWKSQFLSPGINKDTAHKMLFEKKNYGSLPMNEDAGDFTLEMELERNPEAAVVFHEPAAKSGRKDAALYVHNFYNMKAAKNFQGLVIKMLTHPAFAENPNPRDKNRNHFPEQMTQNMDNVKVMMIKDFIKKYPKATKAIAEWPGAMWDESPWSYMYDRYFNNSGTKFKR